MKKQKEQATVTHTEILSWATTWMSEKWGNQLERYRKVAMTDPETAREFVQTDLFRQKLIVLLQLYKIETGKDFGLEVELDIN